MINKENILELKSKNPKIGVISLTQEYYKEIDKDIMNFYNSKISKLEFKRKHNFNPLSIILYGNVTEVDSSNLKELIDYESIIVEKNKYRTSYKCFCGEEYGLNYKENILHGTSLNAWDCALIKIGNPKYAIIFDMNDINS